MHALAGGQKIGDILRIGTVTETACGVCALRTVSAGGTVKEELDRHAQNRADLLQAARPDAVGAFFVFLQYKSQRNMRRPRAGRQNALKTGTHYTQLT